MTKAYNEAHITRHAGLQGIRKKSSVYIGPNDSNGLWTILREPADNGVDLALKNLNKHVHIVIDPQPNKYWVIDQGPGFPVGVKEFEDERGRKEKLSTFYVTTGLTHAGSNFDSDEASRGTHGIGIKATNAMSKVCTFYTFREGQWYAIEYKDARLNKDVHKCKPPKLPHGIKVKKGSVVCFEPDLSLFMKGTKLELADILEWCKLTSYLVPNIEVQITTGKGKSKTYKTKGISEYINTLLEEKQCTQTGRTFTFHSKMLDVAIAFSNAETTELAAYTNGLSNIEGGRHIDAVYDALVKSLRPYKGKLEYTPTDLRDGILGLVNCKIAAPQFNNQRKDKLIDVRAYDPAFKDAFAEFEAFWKKNKSMAIEISRRAAELRKKTADFLKDKKLIKNVKNAGKKMSTKLADIGNKKTPISERELFLVEGDSAGGTAKRARFNDFQATFKLRGKPLNVMEAAKDKVNANEEVTGILAAIGLADGSGKADIRYGKIIFLADPDIDGKHINCLLMALFWKYMPNLFKEGKVYMLRAPEYYAEVGKNIYFADSPEEVYKKAGSTKVDIRHIKGWGELDDYKMTPMVFEKSTRQLIRLTPPKDKDGVKHFEALMGKNSEYRQKMLGVAA